jgi:hypothetical protein
MSTCEARSGTAARVDLTAPVKIYIIIIVQMNRNEHEFYCDNSLCVAIQYLSAIFMSHILRAMECILVSTFEPKLPKLIARRLLGLSA